VVNGPNHEGSGETREGMVILTRMRTVLSTLDRARHWRERHFSGALGPAWRKAEWRSPLSRRTR
jgi:hypothetical protein